MDADALRRRREDEDDYPDCFDDCHRDCEAVGGEKTCYCLMHRHREEFIPARSWRWVVLRFWLRHPVLAVRGWVPF